MSSDVPLPDLDLHLIDEVDLEPVALIRQSGTVQRVGRLTLAAGHGSYRVKSHMGRVGDALGLDEVKAHVALTEITTTSVRDEIFRTEVSEVRTVGINADRLAELENYLGDLPERADIDEIELELERISTKPPLYPTWANALFAGFACGAFAFLNNGGWLEILGVIVAASLGQLLRRSLIHRGVNQFGVTMLASAAACLLYLGFIASLSAMASLEPHHDAGYVSAVLFLVPGFPLVTGALDLARLDLSAGISRLTYALMVLASAALSLWAVSTVVGLQPDPAEPTILDPFLLWTLLTVASFVGVLGFALMFNSPWRMALGAAAIGMAANLLRLFMVREMGLAAQAAAFLAALLVGLAGGLAIALLSQVFAILIAPMPILQAVPQMIPLIVLGNAAIVLCAWLGKKYW
ncbi:MAG: threonine/serine exporter family protein, partial [Promicromonosporaceae bacterium]|nr:threonine/serine exporter family protein [Promicromonosporaceae bacterium]